jgi:hypothetical protein
VISLFLSLSLSLSLSLPPSLPSSLPPQVFLELSKEQELDGFEEELDPSVKWKLLPQEEA